MSPSLVCRARIAAERVVEAAEIRQVGHVLHQALDPRREHLRSHPRRRRAARPRSRARSPTSTRIRCATSLRVLLMLDCSSTELREVLLIWMLYSVGQHALELRAVEAGGAAHQRHAGRIETELVLPHRSSATSPQFVPGVRIVDEAGLPDIPRGSSRRRRECGNTSRSADALLTVAPDLQRDLDRVHDQAVALQLHLAARDVEAGDELLVRAGRGVGEDRLVELALRPCAKSTSLHQHHRALADGRHRLVRRVGLVDAQPDLAADRASAASRAASSSEGFLPSSRLLRLVGGNAMPGRRIQSSIVAAAPIAVRGRRNGDQRAKPNHASSHRKIRSGLIARHSSITRRVL